MKIMFEVELSSNVWALSAVGADGERLPVASVSLDLLRSSAEVRNSWNALVTSAIAGMLEKAVDA